MLFAVIGAVWAISILCMTFVALYFYTLHSNQGINLNYAWDKYRLSMLYILGVAVFYLGTARLVSGLSGLVMSQLNQRPVPLWYPDRWLTLSAICAVLAFMIGLLNRGESEEGLYFETALDDQLILPEIRSLPAPVIRPEDATTYLHSVTKPLAPINILDEEPIQWDGLWTIFRSNAVPALLTTVGICVVTVIGWLVFSQSGILQGIDPSNPTITLAESSQPVTPEIEQDLLGVVVNADFVVPAKPTEDVSLAIGRSAVSAPAVDSIVEDPITVDPIAVESTISVEPAFIEPTTVYTSAIPITLVSAEDGESVAQLADPQPVATTATAIDTPINKTPVAIVEGNYSVNARFSPSTDSAIIKVLPSGTTVPIQEWSPNREWLLVILDDGRSAWVAAWVVEVATITS